MSDQEGTLLNPIRTDMNCTNCSRNFVCEFDFGLDGNHVVECPHCLHEHCRVIEEGEVTEERWSSRYSEAHRVDSRRVWASSKAPIRTSSAAEFIRQAWLNKTDVLR